jgi:hypothetical protein
MPIVTPRQIIEAINSMFGQPTTDLGSVPHTKQSEVRTLLSLLDQLPPDLVNLPFHDFLEFERCRAVLVTALPKWDIHGAQEASIDSKNPVERIRRLLASCPNELPPPEPEFPFVTDDDIRLGIEDRTRAAWIDFNAKEWLGATTSAAVALEAILLWEVRRVRNAARGDDSNTKRRREPNEMVLAELIDETLGSRSISEDTAKQARLARDVRNLIHPGKVARSGTPCDKATALTALAGVYQVASELGRKRRSLKVDVEGGRGDGAGSSGTI